ncbi:NADH-quinone oxidoreductase subunit E [Limoniibacter endophyticus]|uniref:NADH-quinone oxidoreductase subunit E n=1 Tax=Limoniibacter endophyticus TaxID=1565040 RepID=A0A8J3GEH1_9HYPH|nr:NADH-quinone oxidoreductase subunit E [Limoniibacter endophyticus]GHC60367.1 NADH-quinone oxidoreductase subunit E [Limoniibacter endophyticus]
MSVRRLADNAVQPAIFAFSEENKVWAEATIRKYPEGRQQSAVIPLLMRAQEQDGWVTKAAIEYVADLLRMPYIRVLEVATFYTQFQLKPVGRHAHIQVCGTTPCMLRGSEALMEVCKRRIHTEQFETNADGTLSWEEVECLGACVNAPMVMVFKDTYEDLTPERLEQMIDMFEAGKTAEVPVGPQNDRANSEPEGGLTSLTDESVVTGSVARRNPAPAADQGNGVTPPSEAARPKTDAAETDPAIKSPSPVKTSTAGEKAASVAAPKENEIEANKTATEAETVARQRKEPAGEKADKEGKGVAVEGARAGSLREGEKTVLDHPDRPTAIAKPETVDDLKLISGVGPKIETILHSIGIYTFAQVAEWSEAECAWVDNYLRFHGRIARDNWIAQAGALARGGVEEYVRVFGKKPV